MAVQTQIQVRRGTASSWTSTNPTLAAGEWGLETDTGKYKVGTGSAVWTSLAYASILPSTVTTKGDLLAATGNATVTRQAVGTDGSVLMADSSASTGVSYSPSFGFSAGKNKIINGDFGIWQRGTSFTPAANTDTYTADRFFAAWDGTGTTTFSRQAFTAGTAPVAGYEGTYFHRCAMSATATYVYLGQKIEDVRTFAGQTITISFWAKASGSAFTTRPLLRQNFGSGGSANVDINLTDTTFTTSWTRYTFTATLGSVSGKTIGTGSCLIFYPLNFLSGTIASYSIDIWGVQVEAGSVATAFQTATGTIQGELAACQRYFEALNDTASSPDGSLGVASAYNTTTLLTNFYYTRKRSNPAITLNSGNFEALWNNGTLTNLTVNSFQAPNTFQAWISLAGTGFTTGQALLIRTGSDSYNIWVDSEL